MTLAHQLADRIASTRYASLSSAAVRSAKVGLLDTIAVGIAGSTADAAVIAQGWPATKPATRLCGETRNLKPSKVRR